MVLLPSSPELKACLNPFHIGWPWSRLGVGGDGSLGTGMLVRWTTREPGLHPQWMCNAANTQLSRERRYDSVSELRYSSPVTLVWCVQGPGFHPQYKRKGSGICFHVEEKKINYTKQHKVY